jgi:hypothetical protein
MARFAAGYGAGRHAVHASCVSLARSDVRGAIPPIMLGVGAKSRLRQTARLLDQTFDRFSNSDLGAFAASHEGMSGAYVRCKNPRGWQVTR